MTTANSDTLRWKNKYYDSLEDLERKEKDWGDVEELYRRALTRLAAVGTGLNPGLDQKLDALREAVRRKRSHDVLEGLIEDIGRVAARLDDQPEPGASDQDSIPDLLGQLLDGLSFPDTLARPVRRFRQRLQKPGQEPSELLEAFKQLLNDALAFPQADDSAGTSETKTGGLFGRLFHPKAEAADSGADSPSPTVAPVPPHAANLEPATPAPPDLHTPLSQALSGLSLATAPQAQLEGLLDRLPGADDYSALNAWGRELGDLLQATTTAPPPASPAPPDPVDSEAASDAGPLLLELLQQLELPTELDDRWNQLKERLGRPVLARDVPELLHDIAALVGSMRQRMLAEKQALEDFLQAISERLQSMDSALQGADTTREASINSGRELQTSVDQQVSEMRVHVSDAQDLDQLKLALHERLDRVQQHIQGYMEAEEERDQEAQRQIEALGSRINEMEGETHELQKRVAHEREQALHDGLTGLYNRMALDERMEQDFLRWKRYREAFTVMVLDIDHFKKVNDTFGHQAGDKVLKIVAQAMQRELRESDFVARYGGEEFVVLMPKTAIYAATNAAEKLRERIAGTEFHYRNLPVRVTVSCGLAEFTDKDSPASIFSRADDALYKAKNGGRNQCVAG